MNYLIYVSTSWRMLSSYDLKQLLVEIRCNYTQNGITGMMLYSNGTFFQALEGEETQLEKIFENLQFDDIQKSVIKLKSGRQRSRTFSDWSMGFKLTPAGNVSKINGFVDPLRLDFLAEHDPQSPAVNLLKTFAQYNLRY